MYVCSLELIIILHHGLHFRIYLLGDHLLLFGVDDVLLQSLCVVLLREFVGHVKCVNGFLVHLVDLHLVLLVLNHLLTSLHGLDHSIHTSSCFLRRVASSTTFLASFCLPSAISSLAFSFMTSILASYFLSLASKSWIFWSRLFFIFSA